MSNLKRWKFETVRELKENDEVIYRDEISVPVWPSKEPGYNWECIYGNTLFRFKTKKSAKENLNRVV